MDYTTISFADQVAILRDALRGQESDHLRLSAMMEAGDPVSHHQRIDQLEANIAKLKKQINDLEAKANKSTSKEKKNG